MADETPKIGRPSIFTPKLADTICSRIAQGESLRAICREDAMPDQSTVIRWLLSTDEVFGDFCAQYARAREIQAETLVDEILEISDDGTNDWMERQSESEKGAGVNTGWVLNGEHVQRSRLRVDSRKWFASKVAPKKYGDRLAVTGNDGGPVRYEIGWAATPGQATSDPSGKL